MDANDFCAAHTRYMIEFEADRSADPELLGEEEKEAVNACRVCGTPTSRPVFCGYNCRKDYQNEQQKLKFKANSRVPKIIALYQKGFGIDEIASLLDYDPAILRGMITRFRNEKRL